MTAAAFTTIATWSYGLAVVLYALFGLRVIAGWRGGRRAFLLLGAVLASAVWAAGALAGVRTALAPFGVVMNAGDLLRYGFWLAFLANLLRGNEASAAGAGPVAAAAEPGRAGGPAVDEHRGASAAAHGAGGATLLPALAVGGALLVCFLLASGVPLARSMGTAAPRIELALHLGFSILGLALVEQLMRRAHSQARWSLRPLAIALAGVFGYDLFLYADAMLFNQFDRDLWAARGAAHALVIPFVAVATARNTAWTVEMHVSRGAVLHSTALLVSASFLLAVAGAGYLVRYFGGEWGPTLQIELLFAALLCTAVVATSGRFRSLLRVFVSKHFFSYRYDYRHEWLRFTRTLGEEAGPQLLPERVVMALADLVESPGGALWLREEGRGFVPAGRYNLRPPGEAEPLTGSLARFLGESGWIVSVPEYLEDRSAYKDLELPPWLLAVPGAWLVAPLPSAGELVGFVLLTTPRVPVELNWEVRDLLKTASRQAASYLAHVRASEALLEARKFDAFNRMSAFVVHDLKNLVAQLSLLLRNAERHRDNPEFQRDMLATIEHVLARMNKLMLQLRAGTAPVAKPHAVDLGPLARRVCAAKSEGLRPVELDVAADVAVAGHEDRLEHVLGHLVQNALDASPPGRPVTVRVGREGAEAVLEVADEGPGMTEEYVRERLGKPFHTTKAAGMGIGVYESTQYLNSVGGRLAVDSAPGRGTRVRVVLPLTEASAHRAPHPEPA